MGGNLVLGLRVIRVPGPPFLFLAVFFLVFTQVRSVFEIIVITSTLRNDLELIKNSLPKERNSAQRHVQVIINSLLLIISDKNTGPEFCNLLQAYSL